jgi:hypothetical protein
MRLHIAALVLLIAVPAWAGKTSVRSNLVTIVPTCITGTCLLSAQSCTTNADCSEGSISPKSKVSISGSGRVKITIASLLDAAGMPVTTDGVVNTADDYIAAIVLQTYEGYEFGAFLKLDAKNGKSKLNADLASMLPPAGDSTIYGMWIFTPPAVPADCPGTNDPADVAARSSDMDCYSGSRIFTMGLSPDPAIKTSIKTNIVPFPDLCSGTCYLSGGACATNADCSLVAVSAKSKASLTSAGRLKINVTGLVDAAGMPVTTDGTENTADDYLAIAVLYPYSTTSITLAPIKFEAKKGKAKVDIDISALMPPAGFEAGNPSVILLRPPVVPADCPGTNSSADIVARSSDNDCTTGAVVGLAGVVSGS